MKFSAAKKKPDGIYLFCPENQNENCLKTTLTSQELAPHHRQINGVLILVFLYRSNKLQLCIGGNKSMWLL